MSEFEGSIWPNVYTEIKTLYSIPSIEDSNQPSGISGFTEFGISPYSDASGLLSFLDLFVVKYDSNFKSLSMHRDGSLISFTIPLSDGHEGGGTVFECLEDKGRVEVHGEGEWGRVDGNKVKGKVGSLIVHPGKMRQGGGEVIRGERYVLVGFVDVECEAKGLFEACKEVRIKCEWEHFLWLILTRASLVSGEGGTCWIKD